MLVLVSAALANLSTLLTSLAAYTRTLQAAARLGQVPVPLFQKNFTKWRTPVPAIALFTATTAALMWGLDFGSLVVVDSAFYLVGQLSVVGAFYFLKWKEPELRRPYVFPGGARGAAAAAGAAALLALGALYLTIAGEPLYGGVVAAALVGALSCTYAPALLPAGQREALQAYLERVQASGAAADRDDAVAELLERDFERAKARRAKGNVREGALLASLNEEKEGWGEDEGEKGRGGGEPQLQAGWRKWGGPRARKMSHALPDRGGRGSFAEGSGGGSVWGTT